jgi:ABC-type multidrug transport system permease subunit
MCAFYVPVQTVIVIFPDERPVFVREYSSKMYSSLAYFISKMVTELPTVLINSTVSVLVYYFSCNLNYEEAIRFFTHYLYIMLLLWSGNGFGYMFSVMVTKKDMAVGLVPVAIVPMLLVAGFFVNQDNYVPVVIPFEYISPFKWAYTC